MNNTSKLKKPEIMSPIRDWASLEACKNYADAVYFGLSELTMRANADVFTLSNIDKFVRKCHEYKLKAYLTVNSVIYNNDLKTLKKIMRKAKSAKIDAVIVWDPAAIEAAKKFKLKIIISTQANISNYQTALFYKKLGAYRVVVAREMTLEQIKELKKKVGKLEVEAFVHGAMCFSISGRCLLSAHMYGKSANCGNCGQPCRKEWILQDNEGHKLINQGKHFLSAKDLCMIEHVPELIKAGIDSFKLEGRRRDPRYIEVVSRCYREAVDAYFDGKKAKKWKAELAQVYHRGFSTGFFFGTPGPEGINYDQSDNISLTKKILAGEVIKFYPRLNVALINLKHRGLALGDEITFEGKKNYHRQKITSMQADKQNLKKAAKNSEIGIKITGQVKVGDNVFIIK